MSKILLLVLAISASMIIGQQAAYAATDVWGFYCEDGGSHDDAADPGPLSDLICNEPNAGTSSGFKKISWSVGSPVVYNSVAEQNGGPNGPEILVECYTDTANPDGGGNFVWDFTNLDGSGGDNDEGDSQANISKCVQNHRADIDLGIGPDEPEVFVSQPLETQPEELVALFIGDLIDADYDNFMVRFSSNQAGFKAWLATSDEGPHDDGTVTNGAGFNVLLEVDGGAQGTGFDVYHNIVPKDWLYFKQTGDSDGENLIQQIKADAPMIGGSGVPIEQSSLLISGMKTTGSYMIPILMAAAGFGILIARRF